MHQIIQRTTLILFTSLSLLLISGNQHTAEAQIYFSADEKIQVIQSGDTEPSEIIDADAYGLAVDISGGYMYWSESGFSNSSIKRSQLDGSGIEVLNEQSSAARGLSLDLENGFIYWVDLNNDGEILRAELDGQNPEVLIAGESNGDTDGILDLALDLENGHLYWVKTGAVMRADLNGENIETAVSIQSFVQPTAIEVNPRDGYIYWVDTSGENIMRADMGSGNAEIFINADEPFGLSVDVANDRIYWMDDLFFAGSGQVSYANLDGSNPQLIAETGSTRGAIFAAGWELSTSNERNTELSSTIKLNQNYPNPFNPGTVIEYYLPSRMTVSLSVYNSIGQEVAVLANRTVQAAGSHKLEFDASSLPSGIYLYQLKTEEFSLTRKMTLIK